MSVHIIDTFQSIGECYSDKGFSLSGWNEYMNKYLPFAKDVIEEDSSRYDFKKQVRPVLDALSVDGTNI